ncbi:secreted RxLR effector protein 161-like [Cryptomeria japonica]|uniref:secreted RxLR effector protein 161-like n=1 Tax=Cryptomeria japonica TaxID=3369 RepID=UPI0027DAA270|nr:secreted RxLR effector protein 161-like [Cryptomeria japonica]
MEDLATREKVRLPTGLGKGPASAAGGKVVSPEAREPATAKSTIGELGGLIYATTTRPDISFAVGVLSRFMQQPKETHWLAAKRILRYLQGSQNYGLKYSKTNQFSLVGYSDSDYAGDSTDGKSTSGYLMYLGSALISWRSKKQSVPATSSSEAKYMAAFEATWEILWFRRILEDFQTPQISSTPLFIDNQSAIKMAKNPINQQIFLPRLWAEKSLRCSEKCLA